MILLLIINLQLSQEYFWKGIFSLPLEWHQSQEEHLCFPRAMIKTDKSISHLCYPSKQLKLHISLFNSVPPPQFWTNTAWKFNIKLCLLSRDASSLSYEQSLVWGEMNTFPRFVAPSWNTFPYFLGGRGFTADQAGKYLYFHMLEIEQQITALTTTKLWLNVSNCPCTGILSSVKSSWWTRWKKTITAILIYTSRKFIPSVSSSNQLSLRNEPYFPWMIFL